MNDQRLSALLRALNEAGYQTGALTYRKLWEGAVEGRYPAHQVTGRWHFHVADLPAIAATYRLPRTLPSTRRTHHAA